MLIVSDTSPITNLIQIRKLHLLKQLFEEVVIPQKVYEELCDYENQKELIDARSDWMKVVQVKNQQKVQTLKADLDIGEAEAIILAEELGVELLIIDERKGRQIATERGLQIIGLLGILILAKKKSYLKKLKPVLIELTDTVGFRVSQKLIDAILREVNED